MQGKLQKNRHGVEACNECPVQTAGCLSAEFALDMQPHRRSIPQYHIHIGMSCYRRRQSIRRLHTQQNLNLSRRLQVNRVLKHCAGGQWPPTDTKNQYKNLKNLNLS